MLFCLALSCCKLFNFNLTSVIAAADIFVMDWKSVIIISFAKIFLFLCVRLHQTKPQSVRQYIIVDS